jgi:hypothetical protein
MSLSLSLRRLVGRDIGGWVHCNGSITHMETIFHFSYYNEPVLLQLHPPASYALSLPPPSPDSPCCVGFIVFLAESSEADPNSPF